MAAISPVTPTQSRHPWRATVRTVLALVVGLAASWGLIVEAAGVDAGIEWVGTSLLISGAVTRIMALPVVNEMLTSIGLGATPLNEIGYNETELRG